MPALSRKTVTVLFSDVVDWTPIGEGLDPESVRALMARYFEAMRTIIERHGGTVEKYIGDALMAVFGIPHVHEDDAVRAVRAAAEMRQALTRLNDELPRPLLVRTALNTGEVVAGEGHTLVTGDAVNVASRLEGAAGVGEILLGAATYALVRDAVQAEPIEPLELKGKSAPVAAWRLREVVSGAPGHARRFDRELVDRHDELALLRQAFARVSGARSSYLFTVLGMAGVGKSRLARELLVRAQSDGARLAVGRCLPYGEGITYWPLRDVVHDVGDVTTLVGQPAADAIAGAVGATETAPPREETFRAVRRLVEELARDQPFVLLLDDVHWAEPTFLDLVEHLAESVREAPVLILCLARPELYDERPTWGGGKTNATTILLEPLDADDSERLIDVLGGGEIDEHLRGTITQAAEGNPLFLEEMVAMLADDPSAATVPPTIQALLTARLERLAPREREVITAASVVGRFFSRAAVDALIEDAEPALEALERKELIRAQRVPFAEGPAYRFRHILIRDAAYDGLPKAARAAMHERMADWLEETATDVDELVGWHLEQAARYGSELGTPAHDLARRAAALLGAAGLRAFERNDARAAVTLLERAVATLPPGDATRFDLLAELGSALIKAGEFTRADEALAEAAQAGEARIRLRARVDREFVRSYLHPETGSESLVRVAEEVIPQLEEVGDDVGLSKAWWLMSEAHSIACRWEARAEALERALEAAGRAGATRQASGYTGLLAQALYYGPTPVDEAFARCELLLAQAIGDPALEAALTSTLAGLHAMRGEFDSARALWARAAAVYDELGLDFSRAARSMIAAEIEELAGHPERAAAELGRGHAALAAMGERGVRSTLGALLARTLAAQGRDDEADRFATESEETAGCDDLVTQSVLRAARAEVLAHRDEAAAAERLVVEAVEIADATDFLDLQAHGQLSLAAVRRAAGHDTEADEAAARAVEIFERKGNGVAAQRAAASTHGGAAKVGSANLSREGGEQ